MQNVMQVNTDNIRAALGLLEVELSDQLIVNACVADQIQISLASVYPAYQALIDAQAGTPTTEQQQLFIILKLYEMFKGAACLLPQCQLIFAQKQLDGETEMDRFQNNDLSGTIDRILGQVDLYAGLLNPDLSSANGLGFLMLNSVSPTYDPVTNFPRRASFIPDFYLSLSWLGINEPVFW